MNKLMYKKLSSIIISFLYFSVYSFPSFSVDNGKYIGVFKMTYCHHASDSKKGDTGIFEFTIKENKVVKIFTPDIRGWKNFQIDYFFNINESNDELTGYANVISIRSGTHINFKLKMNGLFIGKKFAGEGSVLVTSPDNFLLDKFVFENL